MNDYKIYENILAGRPASDNNWRLNSMSIEDMKKKAFLTPSDKIKSVSEGNRVTVFGASGFVGSRLCEMLKENGYIVDAPTRGACDCLYRDEVIEYFSSQGTIYQNRYIVNLAAFVGGIGLNKTYPYDMGMINAKIGINILDGILEHSRIFSMPLPKLIQVGTVCMYPCVPPVIPFEECDLWAGRPEVTNEPYGLAKKFIGFMAQCAHDQYGLQIVNLIPTNMYGPGDDFSDHASHVIPAMIKKIYVAHRDKRKLELWGDGSPSREFLFVDDFCRSVIAAIRSENEVANSGEFINVGTRVETKMHDLVTMIVEAFGYNNMQVEWDATKPNGQPRRALDCQQSEKWLGHKSTTKLADGLKITVQWFLENIAPLIK